MAVGRFLVMTDPVLLVHAAATLFMVGLIWTVQVVHYPLFAAVGPGFGSYESSHSRRIAGLLALPWSAEVVTAVWLVMAPPAGLDRALPGAGAALLVLIVASTVWVQGPLHRRLGDGFDAQAHRRLLRTNWFRVAAWTGRGVLALSMLAVCG